MRPPHEGNDPYRLSERMADEAFARGVAVLLGSELCEVRPLSQGVLALRLKDGRRLVAKGVARQSLSAWRPGRPWAELVALDALSATGAPVPKLVAADLEHGWLVTEFVAGNPLDAARASGGEKAFRLLAEGLFSLEEAFASEWEALQPWSVARDDDDRKLAAGLAPLLEPGCRQPWMDLAREATQADATGENPMEGGGSGTKAPARWTPGPADVRAANVVWAQRVTFLDMASYGNDVTERRLASYAQRAGREPVSLLDQGAYAWYRKVRGERAAIRLAFYDLLYWGIAIARLLAAAREPGALAARLVTESWGEPEALFAPFTDQWRRQRLDDPRIERVRRGHWPGQEAHRR